jgi:hypothetical protein
MKKQRKYPRRRKASGETAYQESASAAICGEVSSAASVKRSGENRRAKKIRRRNRKPAVRKYGSMVINVGGWRLGA